MRILLTNDDGILAPGILSLCRSLHDIAEIIVVAPDSNRSATGHGITLHHPIMVNEIVLEHGIKGYGISGTPADCVKLAIQGKIIPHPDIIVSGINQGQNLGTDVLYSGTVSAAIEGSLHGIPSIAISLADYEYNEFNYAASFTRRLCLFLNAKGLTTDTLMNVNIPPVPEEEIVGVKVTQLCTMHYDNVFEARVDPKGRSYFWQGGVVKSDVCHEPNTDIEAVRQKYVSVTPIHFDLTNYKIMQEVASWAL